MDKVNKSSGCNNAEVVNLTLAMKNKCQTLQCHIKRPNSDVYFEDGTTTPRWKLTICLIRLEIYFLLTPLSIHIKLTPYKLLVVYIF